MVLSPQLHTTRLPPHILTLSFMGGSLHEKIFLLKQCIALFRFLYRCKLNFSDCEKTLKLIKSRNSCTLCMLNITSKRFHVIQNVYGFLAYIVIKKIKQVLKTFFSYSCFHVIVLNSVVLINIRVSQRNKD